MGDLGKLIVAKGFKRLSKVQKIAQSGHTAHNKISHLFGTYGVALQLVLKLTKSWSTRPKDRNVTRNTFVHYIPIGNDLYVGGPTVKWELVWWLWLCGMRGHFRPRRSAVPI